jgi:hypothetical protein
MANLVIKGHETRGKEVIEILKMLGGNTFMALSGYLKYYGYFINSGGFINLKHRSDFDNDIVYSLEGFLEKFPYKVGDKVKAWVNGYRGVFDIQDIAWDSIAKEVKYKIRGCWHSAENLQPYKEETMEETDTMNHTTEINLNHPCFKGCNEIEIIIPDGWEFKQRDNKMFGVRKQYPKTYEECCEIIHSDPKFYVDTHLYSDTLEVLYKLLICRDAYWKIAGEEMGLGKPWEPDFTNDDEERYGIYTAANKVVKDFCGVGDVHMILTFPTEEMRDAFYDNFKGLIEECKELL